MNWRALARALTVAPPRAIPFLFSFQSHRVILGVSMLQSLGILSDPFLLLGWVHAAELLYKIFYMKKNYEETTTTTTNNNNHLTTLSTYSILAILLLSNMYELVVANKYEEIIIKKKKKSL